MLTAKVSKLFMVNGDTNLKANLTITLGEIKEDNSETDLMCCTGFKLIEGKNGLFLSSPSYKKPNGEYQDITFALTADFRQELTDLAVAEFEKQKAEQQIAASGNTGGRRRR